MTISEAFRKIEFLNQKLTKNKKRITYWASHLSNEKNPYNIEGLLQLCDDLVLEIAYIHHQLHLTKATTEIEYKKEIVTLDELAIYQTFVLTEKKNTLNSLCSKKGILPNSGFEDVKIIINYKSEKRDILIDEIDEEIAELNLLIDQINAQTELLP